MYGLAFHPDGGLVIADGDAKRVVRADVATGRLFAIASTGFAGPTGVAVASDGTIYVADGIGEGVFRIANGAVTQVAQYRQPLHVTVDRDGNTYFTGRENTVVRLDRSGAATRIAGTGEAGSTGDGGPALAARLATPHGIAVDPTGNVVIAEDATVRRIDRVRNVIEGIAGNGTRSNCGARGRALQVCLSALRVSYEPDGDFWISDPDNDRLWRVSNGDAQAFELRFSPFDVVAESPTTVLVADSENRRVMRLDAATGVATQVIPRP